jgi:NAD(P)-dependent dehydrogenase (short-subunit alcohol dehydrogenase family)
MGLNSLPRQIQLCVCVCVCVCVQALRDEVKQSGYKGVVHPVQCDLRQESDILAMFDVIKAKYGGLDICINNAGVMWPSTLIEGSTEQWRDMFEVQLHSLVYRRNAIFKVKCYKVAKF